jgi:hypothetical protein
MNTASLLFHRFTVHIFPVIADAGAAWEEEVLPAMRTSLGELLDRADHAAGDDDGSAMSVQDRIIVASVQSIGGKHAERIKALFFSSCM